MPRIVTLLAAAVLPFTASARTPARPGPSLAQAALAMATVCERSVQGGDVELPDGAEMYGSAPFLKPLSSLPEGVRNFANQISWARVVPPTLYAALPARGGTVWMITGPISASCELAVVGDGGTLAPETLADALLARGGWQRMGSRPAPGPFSHQVLVKMAPTTEEPNFGIRARIQGVSVAMQTDGGHLMDVSFLAGDVQLPTKAE